MSLLFCVAHSGSEVSDSTVIDSESATIKNDGRRKLTRRSACSIEGRT